MKMETIKSEARKRTSTVVGKAKNLLIAGRERMSSVEVRPIRGRVRSGIGKTTRVIGRGAEKASGMVVATTKRAGVQYQLYDLHQKLHKLLAQLGAAVYDHSRKNSRSVSFGKQPIKDLIGKIEDVENKIDGLERRARTMKKAA